MSSEVEFLVKLRDAAAMIMDSCEGRLEALAPAEVRQTNTVTEEIFSTLKWVDRTGEKLASYQTADKKDNPSESWQTAFDILQKAKATISKRYHGSKYQNGYWLFGQDRIFRQLLKKQD